MQGLPYFSYPLYLRGPYENVEDSGIMSFLFLLMLINGLHYGWMYYTNFVMTKMMGHAFLALYVVSIIYVVVVTVKSENQKNLPALSH